MRTLSVDAIQYLASLAGKVPNTRVGLGYDGQRLGIVCFSIVDDKNRQPVATRGGGFRPAQSAFVWYADIFEGVGSSTVFRQLNQILNLATDEQVEDVKVYAKGLHRSTWSFARESKKKHGVKVFEFEKRACGHWSPEEVVASVIDDLYENKITPAPEFRTRPEFEILNSVLRNFKLSDQMDPLAEAAFYGFGYWSALEQRPKWNVGPSNFSFR